MIRALFAVAKTFLVVKTVDAVIGAFTRPRTARRTRTAAAPAKRAASKSRPVGAASKRRAAA